MGLFCKKEKEIEYDKEDCVKKKKLLRELFDEKVRQGDTYDILYAYMTSSKYEEGFFINTNTTSFYYYIVGYRKKDGSIVLVQVDSELVNNSEAYFIDMENVVDITYNKKYEQVCLQYKKGYDSYGEILNIEGTDAKTLYGPKNIYQKEEKEKFLDFLEAVREDLIKKGYKVSKWKRN